QAELPALVLRKRSLDCRGKRIRYHLLIEALFSSNGAAGASSLAIGIDSASSLALPHPREVRVPSRVVVVGDGPCGLFCAYELARRGIAATVVERGKAVQPRRRDLKGLTKRGTV